jgi:hypothetical protein
MSRRALAMGLSAGLTILPALWAQEPAGPRPGEDSSNGEAVAAIAAELEVERTLQEENLQRYQSLSSRRARLLARLSELYRALDEAMGSQETVTREKVESLIDQIDVVEGERSRMQATERALIGNIVTQSRRVVLLEGQLAELQGRRDQEAGELSGVWDVVVLPLDQRGSFSLRQSGTLVTGTYRLRGGWTGSLQGTLVNRKVYLVRIDSKLGRSMELEGFLSSDGRTIRGSWLSYELAGSEGSTGQWSATKR